MKNAVARLEQARFTAQHSGAEKDRLISLGGKMWCLLPWMGTYPFLTLERVLKIKCAQRLGLKKLDTARPYYMQFTMQADADTFFRVLREELERGPRMLFILTNSRALTAAQSQALHRELAENLLVAAADAGRRILLISRGDSTLRGHFPLETQTLRQVMEEHGIGGKLRVLGTPAEENGSGKITMVEEGIFSDVDAALIMHPNDVSIADDISFAAVNMTYTFTGKPAHSAACPWVGADAMTAVNLMYTAVDSQRVHMKDYTRVHGIVLEGGTAVNIITEKAVCQFNIRALDYEYMEQIVEIVNRCAKGAALCAGVEVSIQQSGYAIKNVKNDKRLVSMVEKNMDLIIQSLGVMLMGMCGIFIVMGLISGCITLLNKAFKK